MAPGQPMGGSSFWREGEQLVVVRTAGDVVLPDTCIKCGQPSSQRLNKTYQWHARWIFFFVIISWLIYLILMMIMRKTVKVDFGLCEEHAKKRSTGIMIGVGGGLLSGALMIGGIVGETPAVMVVGIIGLLGAIIAGAMMARTLQPMKMDDHHAWFKVDAPFLNGIAGPGAGPPGGFGGPPGGFGGGFGGQPAGAPPGGFGGPPAGGFGG